MSDLIQTEAKGKMEKAIEALGNELSKLRTGRAHTSLIDGVMVDYYGAQTPLNQVASISVSDARTLMVTPWEKSLIQAIEKAILNADLGLNPIGLGNAIKIPMPPLTEERRKDLIKLVKGAGENARISIRNARRDANTQLKDMLKSKSITEDDERRESDRIQTVTDEFIKNVEGIILDKEKDLMEI